MSIKIIIWEFLLIAYLNYNCARTCDPHRKNPLLYQAPNPWVYQPHHQHRNSPPYQQTQICYNT